LTSAAAVAACAPPGPYPSLEPRPIEKALAASDEPTPEAPLPDDAGLPARIAALLAEARRGQASALPAARATAASAGAAESESWIEAQQALSRLEAAGAVTGKAVSDLDALGLAEEQSRRLSPGDVERIEAAMREAEALVAAQKDEIARIKARIGD
jgi:hypothetical protein